MLTRWFMGIAVTGLALTLAPPSAMAHKKNKDGKVCEKPLGCWVWSCQEIEEEVFDYEVKVRKVTVREPYIKELVETVPCKACIPVMTTSLRTCPEIDYARDAEQIMEESCRIEKDCCGNGCPIHEVTPKIKTCMTRIEVSRQVPVAEWQLVPTNQPFKRTYYIRDWKDVEVEVSDLVKTPKTIKRKVWSKVPAPQCDQPACEAPCETVTAPVEEIPVKPVPDETKRTAVPD